MAQLIGVDGWRPFVVIKVLLVLDNLQNTGGKVARFIGLWRVLCLWISSIFFHPNHLAKLFKSILNIRIEHWSPGHRYIKNKAIKNL
jgi:hypothetical protein